MNIDILEDYKTKILLPEGYEETGNDPYIEFENFRGYCDIGTVDIPGLGICKLVTFENTDAIFDIIPINNQNIIISVSLLEPIYYSNTNITLTDEQKLFIYNYMSSNNIICQDTFIYSYNWYNSTNFDLAILKYHACDDNNKIDVDRFFNHGYSMPDYRLLIKKEI